jgi:MGT family glycosyltransferase
MVLGFITETGISFNSLEEITTPLLTLTELVLCPDELYIGEPFMTNAITYVEPSIRKGELQADVYSLYKIPKEKKIIYASLGSQAIRHGINCDHFYTKVIDVMSCPEFSDLHLIISVDREFDKSKLGLASKNVTIESWASQIDILRVASVAIIHGGLGSVKECIYYGVPMVVFPQGYDQPMNAKCVAHHKLGYYGDIETISLSELKSNILNALYDEDIKIAVQKMKIIFQEKEKAQLGANIVEKIIMNKKALDPQPL